MSFLDKFKDKVSLIGNETIGEIDSVKVEENEEKKTTKPLTSKKGASSVKKHISFFDSLKKKKDGPKKLPEEKTKNSIIEEVPKENKEEILTKSTKKSFSSISSNKKSVIKSHSPMLEILGISEGVNEVEFLDVSDFENVEFTKVAPVGIDVPEVERFVDKTIQEIKKLHKVIDDRQEDFEKLYHEALRLESKVIAYQHDSQLANSILGNKEVEENLKEEIVKLRLENQDLKHQLDVKNQIQSLEDNKKKLSLPEL